MYRLSSSHLYISAFLISVLAILVTQSGQAQSFAVLHQFSGRQDGALPAVGLTMDASGNLYGTTEAGGIQMVGDVFQLKRSGSNWTFNPLYNFGGYPRDGFTPAGGVIFGPNGTLYGATIYGGGRGGGMVYSLRPSATACISAPCPWTETVLYSFGGGTDGVGPGKLIFDQAGNILGTTFQGGSYGLGTVYKLTHSPSGWTESVLHSFSGTDGATPNNDGVIFDNAGNLYGTTTEGALYGSGTIYELSYLPGVGWTESVLYNFSNGDDGGNPFAGLIFDQFGNLYGATINGGSLGGGTVFKLTPSNGGWTYSLIYSFTGGGGYRCQTAGDSPAGGRPVWRRPVWQPGHGRGGHPLRDYKMRWCE